jgi:hypothetical protein
VVTRRGFQSGAIAVARAHRIGLFALRKQRIEVIELSQDSTTAHRDLVSASYALYSFGDEIHGDSLHAGPELGGMIGYEFKKMAPD